MENGVVKDTSGRGLDGLDNTYGGAAYNPYYDATEKALVFDGTNDYVFQNDVGQDGCGCVSISLWVEIRISSAAHCWVSALGTQVIKRPHFLYLGHSFNIVFNNDNYWAYDFPLDTWTNIVVTTGWPDIDEYKNVYKWCGCGTKTAYLSGGATTSSTVNFLHRVTSSSVKTQITRCTVARWT